MPFPPSTFPLFTATGTSVALPSLGLGTFQPDPSVHGVGSVKRSVLEALRAGYRHIDTSLRYGDSQGEREVGEAIRVSGVPREEIFVVTKLENCFHDPKDVEVGIAMSLQNLRLSYVDLYLMHFPYAYKRKKDTYDPERLPDNKPVIDVPLSRAFTATWTAMEALVDKGKTKLIGVSNFSTPKLARLLASARIPPSVNQIEVHPHWPQKGLVEYCQRNGIHVTAFGPLGCAPIPAFVGRTGSGPLEDETIISLAGKYGKTSAQLILAFLICRGISVIPKSNNDIRIRENFECLFEISEENFAVLDDLMGLRGERGVRNLESMGYLGFDNYNEEVEEP